MEPVRSCPICPKCGSKKFEKIKSEPVILKCANCGNLTQI